LVQARELSPVLPTVANKGTLDPMLPPKKKGAKGSARAAAAASAGRGDVVAARPAKVGGANDPQQPVTFESEVVAMVIAAADLERQVVPATVRIDIASAPSRGASDAPLTVIELGDYHAPDTRAVEGTLRDLVNAAPPRVRLVWKDTDRGESGDYQLPSRAARAASELGEFWAMHDRLMAGTRPPPSAEVKRLARTLDLDSGAFAAAIDSDGMADTLEAEARKAGELPVLCTPAFVINGRPVDGGSIAGPVLRDLVDEDQWSREAARAPAGTPAAAPRPARVVGTGPAIAGAAFNPAQLGRAVAAVTARRAGRR
jgi:protein-disulfide isomerase